MKYQTKLRIQLLNAILDRVLDREAVRNTGKIASDKVKEMTTTLGKLTWKWIE